jgi:NADH:ubiquinone oxidoreductase subunit F (NADH-binding)
MKLLTRNWDKINPLDIRTYVAQGGYDALRKAIREMEPRDVTAEVKRSGLQGRGGAGFPVGEKWELAARTPADAKYFVCNLDESEPGTYKDRLITEKNPHQILEGLLIGAFGVGAKKAYIYINGHYQKQAEILKIALEQAREKEFAGRGILGSAIDVEVEIFKGAGAYICGEETALLNSIEGRRGEPRLKPPFPPVAGLHGAPTIVNNAETLANVPYIIRNGAEKYSRIGSPSSPGTKLFVLSGAVKNEGVFEAPLGTTAEELIFNSLYGGGLKDGSEFWFAQIGGASGRLVPKGKLDQPLVYRNCEYPLGSGSIFVVDKATDIKELLFSWADFFHRESCGKCVPCREGMFRLWEIAKRLKNNDLRERDRENAEDILWTLNNTTFCPLGRFAATAWGDAMRIFREEIFE